MAKTNVKEFGAGRALYEKTTFSVVRILFRTHTVRRHCRNGGKLLTHLSDCFKRQLFEDEKPAPGLRRLYGRIGSVRDAVRKYAAIAKNHCTLAINVLLWF